MPEFPLRRTLSALLCAALLSGAVASVQTAGAQTVATDLQAAPARETVTVQPGDTAYSLSRRAGLSVDALLALNGLPGPALRVGQVLLVRETPPHSVQAGETLYSLARRYGVTVPALLAANTLGEGAVIEIGQRLRIPPPNSGKSVQAGAPLPAPQVALNAATVLPTPAAVLAAPTPLPAAPALPTSNDWREMALALLGTPYVYGGTSRSGLDCSGFVLQVFTPFGVRLPRQSADQARAGVPVGMAELQAGDLLFFDTEGRGRVTHVGIYLGDGTMANANSYKGQVAIDQFQADRYWAPRYLGARRVLGGAVASQP
ncbi:LysM peptidoglycan-binding domain-containing protein [Deinococcus petrolearius]|uniref:LysM peptidoglycan-binding domain-containing protein n=1 Tax=Deinococcus petrolearius TaxID=1751295 RepID=A0ABW1DG07_9DEIO